MMSFRIVCQRSGLNCFRIVIDEDMVLKRCTGYSASAEQIPENYVVTILYGPIAAS